MRGHRVNPFTVGLATCLAVLVVVSGVVVSGLPGGPGLPLVGHGRTFDIELADADALAPHASVSIAGVKVGEVTRVSGHHDPTLGSDMARVTVEIDPQYADIHSDAHALLRPHDFFAPKYVDLQPGHADKPLLADGDLIPSSQTTQPVDLDQVLQDLQAPEQEQLRTAIVQLGMAARGRGDDVNHLTQAAQSLTSVLDNPVLGLAGVRANLDDMLVQNEATNASVAQAPLDQLVARSSSALGTLAANSDHIASLLVHGESTLADLDAALSGKTPALRATLQQLPATLDQLTQLENQLAVFGANITGREPGSGDVTNGIIGAIENVRSAFSGYDACDPGKGTCPADGPSRGQAHYVKFHIFNVPTAAGKLAPLCQLPVQLPYGLAPCLASDGAPAGPSATVDSTDVLGTLLTG